MYYDTIGLLPASTRSASSYRLYTEQALQRMLQIQTYREAGLPLETIQTLLASSTDSSVSVLERHLHDLNREMQRLRRQQQVIIRLLESPSALNNSRTMTKQRWVEMLRVAGLDETGMNKWHDEFEYRSPEAHQDFLESLGIEAEEIQMIRQMSRQ